MRQYLSGILLIPWFWPVLVAQIPPALHREPADTLPIRHRLVGNALHLSAGALRAIEVAPSFAYLGGQRFILGGTADAEQHLFVVADSNRSVQRLYWIQIEERLPDQPGGFDYSADSTVMIQGFPLAANFRTYATPPVAGSDRARAYTLVTGQGYRVPDGATRVRLVYLPDTSARREIMIVYLEPTPAGQSDVGSRAALISRAGDGLTLRPMP